MLVFPAINLNIVIPVNEKQNKSEARDDILVNFALMIHIIADAIAEIGERARNVPAAVAAPFPPLNFNHIGYTCPRMQQNPIARGINELPEKIDVRRTITVPLSASDRSV